MDTFITRHCENEIRRALLDTPAVIIQGARQVGKSTLAQKLMKPEDRYVTLDDPSTRFAADQDPRSFVDSNPNGCLVIDEIQRAPSLILSIKAAIDRQRRPGKFLITGSANLLKVKETSDSLAGRAETVNLYGLSQAEIEGSTSGFVDRLMNGELSGFTRSDLDKRQYVERACAGGYPEALKRVGRRRDKWFDEYVRLIVQRDALDLSSLRKLGELPKLFELLACHSAEPVNNTTLSRGTNISHSSVPGYLELLETMFLIHRLQPWSNSLAKRVGRTPKIYVADSGIEARLLNATPTSLMDPSTYARTGQLIEGFVAEELRKMIPVSESAPHLYYYRDLERREIDFLLETSDGRIAAIEVKASQSVSTTDIRWLQYLRELLGRRFVGGVLLHAGQESHSLGDRISSAPISALWRSDHGGK